MWACALVLAASAALLPGIWTAAGLAAAVVLVLIVTRPDTAIYLLALSVPLGSLLEIGEQDSVTLSPTEVLVALLLVGWVARALARRRITIPLTPLLVPLLAMLSIVVISSYQATSFSLSVKEALKWVELIAVYLYVVAEMGTMRKIAVLLGFLFAGATIEAIIGLVQFAFGIGPEPFAIGRFMRAYGTFEQPNPYAGYLGMLLPLMAVCLLARPSKRLRNAVLLVLLLTAAAIAASLSRGAWMGLGLAVAVMMVFWSRRSRVLLGGGAVALTPLGALAFLNILPAEITTRLATALDYFRFIDVRNETLTPDNWAVLERVAHWQAALDMIAANPIFGVGAGNYPAVYKQYMVQGWEEALGHAHNFYLNVTAETGFPGLAIYLALLATMFVSVIRWLAKNPDARGGQGSGVGGQGEDTIVPHPSSLIPHPPTGVLARAILLGVLGTLVATSMHNLFDNLFVHGMGIQLGMILALSQVAASTLSGSASTEGRSTS